MLDLLDEYIELRGWNRYRIDGRGGHGANQDEINEFNTAPFSDDSKPHWGSYNLRYR
jgi:ATP-dependent DNA helicase